MAKIKLKVIGSPIMFGLSKCDIINAENVSEIIQHQRLLDDYEYDYSIFLNGIKVNIESKSLHDGDEVVLVPIASGG